ncbi:MAG: GAF domain-containing protein [Polyangiaceae bacterium]|nr:GAF domain-containing protein [Polyangiaceae bacterium]
MSSPRASSFPPEVLHAGRPRLDGVLEFVSLFARSKNILGLLDEAPKRICDLFDSPICSLYVLEGKHLVLRANVGFGRRAIGDVRLRVGEGITGRSVEFNRPIVAERAEQHAFYKYVDGLGEEEFPAFMAVPLRGKSEAVGALVVQRKGEPYTENDVELLVALGGLVAAGLRYAESESKPEPDNFVRKAGGGTRKLTLPGRPLVHGRALGAIAALRRPPSRPNPSQGVRVESEIRRLKGAFDVAEKAIVALTRRASQKRLGKRAGFLATYNEILSDMRFRERVFELLGEGEGVAEALEHVAGEVTRVAHKVAKDPFLEERANDIEDLCDALSMIAASDKRVELPQRAIVIGDEITVFDLLVTARSQPVGVALSDRPIRRDESSTSLSTSPPAMIASRERTETLLELLSIPAIVDVEGLYQWASDGDVALLDAEHGLLMINPSRGEIASLREYRREEEKKTVEEKKTLSEEA